MKTATVHIEMLYEPRVSVNAAYYRKGGRIKKVREVEEWLETLGVVLQEKMIAHALPPVGGVQLDVTVHWKRKRGGRPDVSNFRKIPQDAIAGIMGVNDSTFYGYDNPLVIGEEDKLVYELRWEYLDKRNCEIVQTSSAMAMGPMTTELYRRLGVEKDSLCHGFGSAYCMSCPDAPACDVQYTPRVYSDVPCLGCEMDICPCLGNDSDYPKRREAIDRWWKVKRKHR